MTALAADRETPRRDGNQFSYPVAAAVTCYAGALLGKDAAGNVKPYTAVEGLLPVGRCDALADNSAGIAAAINAKVNAGVHRWVNSGTNTLTKANIGQTVYAEDDQTVGSSPYGYSPAGIMVDIDTDGVWVASHPDMGAAFSAGPFTQKSKTVTLTAAQIKAAATTPITAVGAAAGKVLIPITSVWIFTAGTEVLAEPSAPDDFALRWADGSGAIISQLPDSGILFASAGPVDAWAFAHGTVGAGVAAGAVNVPIVIHNTGTDLTGNASNDASLQVTVAYFEVPSA